MKYLLPRSRLRARTFRAAAGQTVLIGGLARIDVVEAPGATLYLTVWASSDIVCHFGKSEGADERWFPPAFPPPPALSLSTLTGWYWM